MSRRDRKPLAKSRSPGDRPKGATPFRTKKSGDRPQGNRPGGKPTRFAELPLGIRIVPLYCFSPETPQIVCVGQQVHIAASAIVGRAMPARYAISPR